MTNKTNMQVLEGNWDEIKGEVKSRWRKLSKEQVDNIKGKYDKLVTLLHDNYGYKEEEIEDKISEFIDRLDIEEAVSAFQNAKDKIGATFSNSVDTVKEKSQHVQENVTEYIKENPIKTIGFSIVAGMLASILIKRK